MSRVLLAIAMLVGSAPASATACSPGCDIDVLPHGTSSAPAHLPANGVQLLVVDSFSAPSIETLSLVRSRGGATETTTLQPVRNTIAITDAQEGDVLTLTFEGLCGTEPRTVSTVVEVTASAPVPTALGVLTVEPTRAADVDVWDNRGGCASPIGSVVAPYEVTLDPSVVPWADALIVTSMLDGAPWLDPSDPSVAPHFVFAHCAPPLPSQTPGDATQGDHRLRIEATLRGLDTSLATNEVRFTLRCAGDGGGCAVSPRTRQASATWCAGLVLAATAIASRRRRRT